MSEDLMPKSDLLSTTETVWLTLHSSKSDLPFTSARIWRTLHFSSQLQCSWETPDELGG